MKKNKGLAIVQIYKEVSGNKRMLIKLAKNDFKTKYAGSYLGIFWAFVQPIITILLYWFVFQVGMRGASGDGRYPYVLTLTAGLVPWFYFNDAWSGATSSLVQYTFLVKKVVFEVGILPVIKVLSAFFVNIFFTIFMIIMLAFYGYYPDLYYLQLIYCFICITIFVSAISYMTSSLVVFVRDLQHLLTVVLQVLMWMTPIMWSASMLENHPTLLLVLKLNPVFYIVQCYRDSVLNEVWFWEHPLWTAYFWVLTIAFLFLGTHIFQKLRCHFADLL